MFVHAVRPHADSIFNTLEFINEYSMVILAYIMLKWTNLTANDTQQLDSVMEYVAVVVVFLMAALNLFAMIKISVGKMILKCKLRKITKASNENKKLQLKKASEESIPKLPAKNQLITIQEAIVEEDEDDLSNKGTERKIPYARQEVNVDDLSSLKMDSVEE